MKGIYLIENRKSDEKYIGSSYKIHSRWGVHLRLLLQNKHHCKALQETFNKGGVSDLLFSILEIVATSTSDKELEEKESQYSSSISGHINRLPRLKDGNVNFTHTRETIINILKTQHRYKPVYVIDSDNNILGEFEVHKDVARFVKLGIQTVKDCLLNKKYHRGGYGFIYKEDYGKYKLSEPKIVRWKIKDRELIRNRIKIKAYTVYGEFYKEFDSIKDCANHFNTAAGNIHRKINVIFSKKNLIDHESSKYIFMTEKNVDRVQHLRDKWNIIFSKLHISTGNYKIHDCFNNYLGSCEIEYLSELLFVRATSTYNALYRGTYIKTLKIIK